VAVVVLVAPLDPLALVDELVALGDVPLLLLLLLLLLLEVVAAGVALLVSVDVVGADVVDAVVALEEEEEEEETVVGWGLEFASGVDFEAVELDTTMGFVVAVAVSATVPG
jgi:hypothetical protein